MLEMESDLAERIRRMYAAIGASEERNLANIPARIDVSPTTIAVRQDFRGGLSQEELVNRAYTLIYNLAHLADHLRKWAKKNRQDESLVESTIKASSHLQLVID